MIVIMKRHLIELRNIDRLAVYLGCGTSLNLCSLLVDMVCNNGSHHCLFKCMKFGTELSRLLSKIRFVLYFT